jgi:ABC-type Na+ transport system ATPase subunit NatA
MNPPPPSPRGKPSEVEQALGFPRGEGGGGFIHHQNAALTVQGAGDLHLRDEGMAIIYISHRMAEVYELSDRVSVLRDGQYVGSLVRGLNLTAIGQILDPQARLAAGNIALFIEQIAERTAVAEVYELSDRVSVLRDGQYVGSLVRDKLNAPELVTSAMRWLI